VTPAEWWQLCLQADMCEYQDDLGRALVVRHPRMPTKWERRFVQVSPWRGEEVMLIKGAGIIGEWTSVRTNKTVSTVELTKGAARTAAFGGLLWTYSGTNPSSSEKSAAEASADTLIAQGVIGALMGPCAAQV